MARLGKDWIVPSFARTYGSSASTMSGENRLREESDVDEVRPEAEDFCVAGRSADRSPSQTTRP